MMTVTGRNVSGRKNRKAAIPLSGISAVITVFAVLCLVTFALLVLSTAQADHRLADKAAEHQKQWYAADTMAETVLAQLRAGAKVNEITEFEIQRDGNIYSYRCPVSDTLCLAVKVSCDNGKWTVLSWKEIYTAEWESDDSIEIWDGDITDLDLGFGGKEE